MPYILIIDKNTKQVVNVAVPPKKGDTFTVDDSQFESVLSETGGIGWTYDNGVLTPPPEPEDSPEE